MSLTIRPARPDHASALTNLSLSAKRSNGYDAAFMAACVEELTVTEADVAGGGWWIAEDDGALGGCVCLHVVGEVGEVHAFYVDPAQQRRGIGRALWAHVMSEAAAKGVSRLELDADPHAVGFYEGLGFSEIGRVPSGSIPGRTLPRMAYDLGGRGS